MEVKAHMDPCFTLMRGCVVASSPAKKLCVHCTSASIELIEGSNLTCAVYRSIHSLKIQKSTKNYISYCNKCGSRNEDRPAVSLNEPKSGRTRSVSPHIYLKTETSVLLLQIKISNSVIPNPLYPPNCVIVGRTSFRV
jgi:hypothetical protein